MDEFEPIHKNGGIYKKNTTACRMRQEGFEKFIDAKNAGEKPLRWLGKTNSRSKNSTPTGRCQAETDKFTGAKFFRCGKRFASSMPQGKLQ